MTPACTAALDALARALDRGEDPDAATRAHLETCATCRARLAGVASLLGPEQPVPAPDARRVEAAARSRYLLRQVLRALAVGLALAVLGAVVVGTVDLVVEGPTLVLAVGVGLAVLAAVAILLARLPSRHGLWKRLRTGRQVSGVCLGLAEFTGTPVAIWRVGFLGLALLHGWGIWLYLLLDLAMPIHPEDRPHLLRHRLARWWRGLRTSRA